MSREDEAKGIALMGGAAIGLVCLLIMYLITGCSKKPKPPDPAPPPSHEFGEASEEMLANDQVLGLEEDAGFVPVLYFDLNSTRLQDPGQAFALARYLTRTGKPVRLEGHACPLGTYEYNEALGFERARRVRELLEAAGVARGRIEVMSYGEERPISQDPADFPRCRRVEVMLP